MVLTLGVDVIIAFFFITDGEASYARLLPPGYILKACLIFACTANI